MTWETQLTDDNNSNGRPPSKPSSADAPSKQESQPFQIAPEVELAMRRGQELRAIASDVRDRLTNLVNELLLEFREHEVTISKILEGEAQRVRSFHEQTIRREREARRAKENGHVTNRSSEGGVPGSVQNVPGRKSDTGSGTEGSSGSDGG